MSEQSHGKLERIDSYRVLALLGSGSFADTYHVEDSGGNQYALKILHAGANLDARGRFKNEKWALKTLDHPSIPKFVDQGTASDGRDYLVETLAKGESLREHVKRQRQSGATTGESAALHFLGQVLQIVGYIHSCGVLHRDIKDANIIADPALSDISLLDFGFCKSGGAETVDVPSVWNVGAAKYAPPSKLEHPTCVHPTHDVFAVGVLGYLLLTNYYPWDFSDREDRTHLKERMMTRPLIPISDINSLISGETCEFIARLLTINDADRPSAADAYSACVNLERTFAQTAKRRSETSLDLLWNSPATDVALATQVLSTRRISAFPKHLVNVIDVINGADDSICIMVDCVDNGSFSDPALHRQVIEAIERARRLRSALDIRLLVCGEPAPISRTSEYYDRDFDTDLCKDAAFMQHLTHYCEFHRILSPLTHEAFVSMLKRYHEDFARRLHEARVEIGELPEKIAAEVPFFLWICDGKHAVFCPNALDAKHNQVFFRTHDPALVGFLRFAFERYWRSRTNAFQRLYDAPAG